MSAPSSPHPWPGRRLRALLAGILLYGLSSWATHLFYLSNSQNLQIRPGVAIPIVAGFIFGPLVGFGAGALGNVLGDLLSGNFRTVEFSDGSLLSELLWHYHLHWQIGNGLMGLLPGLMALWRPRYCTWRDQLLALGVATLGIVLGMGLAEGVEIMGRGGTWQSAFDGDLLRLVSMNLLMDILLVPLLLYNYARFKAEEFPWRTSRLLRNLALVLVLAAGLPVVLLGIVASQELSQPTANINVLINNLRGHLQAISILTLVMTIAGATLLGQQIVRPILRLTEAARRMEAGSLSRAEADELVEIKGANELARLGQLFGRMAREVIQREETMRQRIADLQIEIDVAKRDQQVSEITESEYFRDLRKKAGRLRQRKPADDDQPPAADQQEPAT